MYTLFQLQCFVAVADELHFGAAAERLRMTQPPLSRQVQLLERDLGALVFARTSRSVRLTQAGIALLPHARRMLELAERARDAARAAAEGREGSVSVGYTSTAALVLLPALLRASTARLPDVRLDLHEHVTGTQLAMLRSGAIDLALLRPGAMPSDLMSRRIHVEPLAIALPVDHPVGDTTVRLEQMRDEPCIGFDPLAARALADAVDRLRTAAGHHAAPVHSASQVSTVLALVEGGLGYAIVPASAASLLPAGVRLAALHAEHAPTSSVELHAAWRVDDLPPAAARVLQILGDVGRHRCDPAIEPCADGTDGDPHPA